jgi:DNA-binding NarL/FixJ family response regulator
MRALLVDDHALVREGLKQVLWQIDAGMEIFEAKDAAEVGDVLRHQLDLDLVLLDLVLPGQSGFHVLELMREKRTAAAIVVLSASRDLDDIQRALKMGAVGYIPKNYSAGVTLGALRVVLAGGIYVPPDLLEGQHGLFGAAQRTAPPAAAPLRPAELGLSERQAQVLTLLVRGLTNKAIAQELKLAEQTVKAHMSAALRALNVSNRTQAAIAVAQLGLDLNAWESRLGVS